MPGGVFRPEIPKRQYSEKGGESEGQGDVFVINHKERREVDGYNPIVDHG
tara:strand:- start:250 stop:399 length:150 start_codon:yes stop_codon:yes gene_type:complete